jgi:hypothetical protein
MFNPTPDRNSTMPVATHHPDRAAPTGPSTPPTPAAHVALAELLHAAQRIEAASSGPDRRVAFRNTRSLIGAARRLGFTFPELGLMLGTSEGSARTRSQQPSPMQPSAFRALVPPEHLPATDALLADFDPEPTVDVVTMLEHYLNAIDAPQP